MEPQEATSEAQATEAQEQAPAGVAEATNPPAASTAPAPVQEQPPATPAPEFDPDALLSDPEKFEAIRRRLQSKSDQRANQLELQLAQVQEQLSLIETQRQAQELAGMDDETLGKLIRERAAVAQQEQALRQKLEPEITARQRQQDMTLYIEHWLNAVPDKRTRDDIQAKLQAGSYAGPEAFAQACQAARDAHIEAKAIEKTRQTVEQVARKEANAQVAEAAVPDLGTGRPVGTQKVYHSTEELLADGWEEETAKKRK